MSSRPEGNSETVFADGDGRISRGSAVILGLIVVLFAAVYSQPSAALVRMWWGSDDYTHGFLVPLISLYIVWHKGRNLLDAPADPAVKSGALLTALAGAILIVGKIGSVLILQELSIPLMIAGLVLLLAGTVFLKALWFPIAYLLFMVKIFGEGSERFHWPFQLLAAKIGVWILQAAGIPAYKDAQYIQLPNIMLEVASACSGLRFLVSIIAIGIPLAWLTHRSWARRVGLVAFAVMIAVLANGARVALIGVWAFYGGKVVHGPMHVFQGMFVAWIGFIALFAGAWFLSEKNDGAQKSVSLSPVTLIKGIVRKISTSTNSTAARLTAVCILFATGFFYFAHRTAPVQIAAPLSTLPSVLGGWQAVQEPSDDFLKVTGGKEEFSRIYRKGDSVFRVYLSYYDEQAQGREMVNYLNSWKLHRSERPARVMTSDGSSEQVNVALLKEGQEKRLAFFWYQMEDTVMDNKYKVKLWTVWRALSEKRTNGTIVILSAPASGGNDIRAQEEEAKELAGQVIPFVKGLLNINSSQGVLNGHNL